MNFILLYLRFDKNLYFSFFYIFLLKFRFDKNLLEMATADLNEERKNIFIQNYHHLIEERVRRLDNRQHTQTTSNRHYNRLRNRVIEDMMSEQRQISYVSQIERDNYSKKLIRLDDADQTHFWKHKLAFYDAEDAKLGTTKEERLAKHQNVTFGPITATKRKSKHNCEKRKKLKSVVIKPLSTPTQKSTPIDAPKEKYWLETFLEDTAHKYGDLDYEVPKALPPTYSQSHPEKSTVYIMAEKLEHIKTLKISAEKKRHLLVEEQETKLPSTEDYDFHDFDLNHIVGDDYGDLGLDF